MSATERRTRPVLRQRVEDEMTTEVETFTAPDTPNESPYIEAAYALRDQARARMLDAYYAGYLNEALPEAERAETENNGGRR